MLAGGATPYRANASDIEGLTRAITQELPIPLAGKLGRGRRARALAAVIERALAKSPADRFATAELLALDLRRWLRDEPVSAAPASRFERLRLFARRHRHLLATLLTTVSVLAGAATLSTLAARRAVVARGNAAVQLDAAVNTLERIINELTLITTRPGVAERARPWATGVMVELKSAAFDLPTDDVLRQRVAKLLERLSNVAHPSNAAAARNSR